MYGVLQVFKILSIFLPEFQRNTIWPIEYRLSFFTYQKKSSFSFWYFAKYQNESKSFWVYRDETFSLQFVISVSLFVDSFFIGSHKKALTLVKVTVSVVPYYLSQDLSSNFWDTITEIWSQTSWQRLDVRMGAKVGKALSTTHCQRTSRATQNCGNREEIQCHWRLSKLLFLLSLQLVKRNQY